jgi:type IV secretory pathway ATPase VirB11/archaellum biosynthesis ATPase
LKTRSNSFTSTTAASSRSAKWGLIPKILKFALKNTLRQAPDVILIGEIRTREVMDYAIAFAETGHLVLATLHANNANQAWTASSTSSRPTVTINCTWTCR